MSPEPLMFDSGEDKFPVGSGSLHFEGLEGEDVTVVKATWLRGFQRENLGAVVLFSTTEDGNFLVVLESKDGARLVAPCNNKGDAMKRFTTGLALLGAGDSVLVALGNL